MAEIKSVHEIIEEISPHYKKKAEQKKKKQIDVVPEAEHLLVYDSSSDTLEPIYFFILDLMSDFRFKTDKLVDNFTSSPGSGHFGDLGQRATIMQQQGVKLLGDVNTVLQSTLNIIYDLKEFKIRLEHYEAIKSKNKNTQEAAKLSLKQIWMDKVDIAKGNSSIKAMALGQAGFQTLLDAFLITKNAEDADKLDLNDRVKRIVKMRIEEFSIWLGQSEKELRKRYDLEKNYLRSQVNSLKLYTRWVKPYLKAAEDLAGKEQGRNPDLVKTFNTILLDLVLLGRSEIKVKDLASAGDLSKDLKSYSEKKRKYYTCVLVDFDFRGIPQRVTQGQQGHYAFGGKTKVTFRAYALNDDELKKLDQELDKSDLGDALGLIEGTTEDSLKELQKDIDSFLDEKTEEEKKKEEKEKSRPEEGSNPIMALLGMYGKSESKEESSKEDKKKNIIVKKDDWIEKNHLRKYAAKQAEETAYKLFDVYKKAHRMPSFN
jgi:hypothetical protein